MEQQTYLKVPFVWEEPQPLIEVPSRLTFKATKELGDEVLLLLVTQVIESSADASDKKKVAQQNSHQVAKQFLSEAKDEFSYQDDWWQVGINSNGTIVGFVLPVIYPGYDRDGLEEATIYYIGVLPEHRGHGFATDLLSKGTRALQEVGVWRIFCDTDANNVSMISTFERVGYQQHDEPYRRPL